MKTLIQIFGAIVILIFFYYGLVANPSEPCGVDNASLWCNLHPFSILDGFGVAFFLLGAMLLTGWFAKQIELANLDPKAARIIGGILIIIGFILTLI